MSKALRIAGLYPGGGRATALWDDASDDDPFTDPLNNLARVKFHDRLDYIKVIDEQTHTLNFPGRNFSPAGGEATQSYTLFAHGQSGIPLVFASALVGGVDIAFTGSVPVQRQGFWARWVTVGADAINVYAYEYFVSSGLIAAISIPITVWVTDEDLS